MDRRSAISGAVFVRRIGGREEQKEGVIVDDGDLLPAALSSSCCGGGGSSMEEEEEEEGDEDVLVDGVFVLEDPPGHPAARNQTLTCTTSAEDCTRSLFQ